MRPRQPWSFWSLRPRRPRNDVFPISIAIAILLAIVVASYRQTVMVYQSSGGAYIVAKENLGRLPSLVAAAALLTDYVLTVAVSVAAGVLPSPLRFRR